MTRLIASVLCSLSLFLGSSALAQGVSGTVVELFTSQGCSSCPPADAYLAELATEPGVIPLALHVDYWDYIGWQDKFASPKFTDRQKAYARNAGSNTIYTPQMIVGGTDRVEGSDPFKVEGAIRRHQSAEPMVALQLMRAGGTLTINATARAEIGKKLIVQLIRYNPKAKVEIEYGENAGMTIEYSNTVTSWVRVGEWEGSGEFQLKLPVEGEEPIVVILQAEGPGMIFAASVMK